MKALVVGGGSIGRRHLRNLQTLGVEQLALAEVLPDLREQVGQELGVQKFGTLEDGLLWGPQFVIVATPPHLHIQQALLVTDADVDLFIEKPMAHRAEGIELLVERLRRSGCVSMVGCNMRFHPGPVRVKQFLDESRLGKIRFARLHVGSYLPEWRPGADYRKNYAAKAETGGGCMLDCIHEIDLARWYLGEPEEVMAYAARLSNLEIETEDYAFLLVRHASGAMAEIHLDYLQRTYERGCQIVGESGSVFWDFRDAQVRWYDATLRRWTEFAQPATWTLNDMYVAEMRHFLECVRDRKPTTLPVAEAAKVMELVFAAKQSAQEKSPVSVHREVIV